MLLLPWFPRSAAETGFQSQPAGRDALAMGTPLGRATLDSLPHRRQRHVRIIAENCLGGQGKSVGYSGRVLGGSDRNETVTDQVLRKMARTFRDPACGTAASGKAACGTAACGFAMPCVSVRMPRPCEAASGHFPARYGSGSSGMRY